MVIGYVWIKNIELNKNENTAHQNLYNTAKGVLRGNFIALNAYIQKEKKYHINNLNYYHKKLEKEEQAEGNNKLSRKQWNLK